MREKGFSQGFPSHEDKDTKGQEASTASATHNYNKATELLFSRHTRRQRWWNREWIFIHKIQALDGKKKV